MSSRWDFGESGRPHFEEIATLITTRKGFLSPFEESVLVAQIKEFGFEIMKQSVFQCMANNWLRCTQWAMLARLYKRFGSEAVDEGIERLNGRENYSIDTLEGILVGSIPARRKPVATGKPEPARPKASKYPTPDGLHTQMTAQTWLVLKGHSLDSWPEFFEGAGTDPEHGFPLLRLLSRYR